MWIQKEHFDFPSNLHGISHTLRVMLHTRLITTSFQSPGWFLNASPEDITLAGRAAFRAAMIHDMARKHDNEDFVHGADAAVEKYHLLSDRYEILTEESQAIHIACMRHSITDVSFKPTVNHLATAILKDADALDRIRLGDLDPKRLRLRNSHHWIRFAEVLYENFSDVENWEEMIDWVEAWYPQVGLLINLQEIKMPSDYQLSDNFSPHDKLRT
jgi:hypothetical protein